MFVFVYGTLTDPERVDAVVDEWSFAGEAVLEGLVRADGQYPTLVPPTTGGRGADDGPLPRVDGRLLETPDVDALDAYEGVARGLYVRVTVPVVDGAAGATGATGATSATSAAVYVGDPSRLGAGGSWSGTGPFAGRVRRYVDQRGVAVRPSGTR